MSGRVGRALRAAGGQVNVRGPVGSDAVLAGGRIEVWDKATIGRDLIAAGGTVSLADSVGDDALLIADQVRLEDGAMIAEKLVYASDKGLFTASSAVVKGNVRDQSARWKIRSADPQRARSPPCGAGPGG